MIVEEEKVPDSTKESGTSSWLPYNTHGGDGVLPDELSFLCIFIWAYLADLLM